MQVSPMGPFTLGKILSETIGMYRRNAFGFLAIAAIVQTPPEHVDVALIQIERIPYGISAPGDSNRLSLDPLYT